MELFTQWHPIAFLLLSISCGHKLFKKAKTYLLQVQLFQNWNTLKPFGTVVCALIMVVGCKQAHSGASEMLLVMNSGKENNLTLAHLFGHPARFRPCVNQFVQQTHRLGPVQGWHSPPANHTCQISPRLQPAPSEKHTNKRSLRHSLPTSQLSTCKLYFSYEGRVNDPNQNKNK